MEVHILGAHQGESRDVRFISLLVDGRLAIDAGGLTGSLSLDEQEAIEAVLVTHRHYDHVKDLPMLAHNLWESRSLDIYCTDDTLKALRAHLFNNVLWPNMEQASNGFHPVRFHTVEPGKRFDLLGYSIESISMPHSVPTVGYAIERDGKKVFYTADTRGEGDPHWSSLRPDLLIIEVTMSNSDDANARRFGHLSPMALGRELSAFREKEGYYPRTVCVHINPAHEQQIHEELLALSHELGADISVGREGMMLTI